MKIRYCYPPGKRRKGMFGHLVKSTEPGKSLCGIYLLNSGAWYDKPLPGYAICDECKKQREKIKPADIDLSQITPESEAFLRLSPEDRLTVLELRQAARKRKYE